MKSISTNPNKLEALLTEKQNEIDSLKKELELLRLGADFTALKSELEFDVSSYQSLLFENTDDLMYLLSAMPNNQFRFVGANQSYLKSIGKDRTTLLNKDILDVFDSAKINAILDKFNLAVESKKQLVFEENIELKGKLLLTEITLTPILNDKKEVLLLLVLAKEVKSVNLIAFHSQKSETKYRLLFEQVIDAIIIFEPNTEQVLEVNNKACEIYGFTKEEFLQLSLKKLTKNIEFGEEHIKETVSKNEFINFETVQFNKNKKELTLLVSASVIEYNGRKAILSINRDITELKQKETQINEAQTRIVNITNNFPNASIFQYLVDSNNNIAEVTFMSAGAKDLFGHSPEEIINDPNISYQSIHSLDLAGFLEELAFARVYEKDFEYTYRIKVNGKVKWAHTRSQQKKLSNGLIQWDGLTIDVTNNKLNEIKLIESQRFLNSLINNLPGFAYRLKNDNHETPELISDGIKKVTGYEPLTFLENPEFFASILHQDDKHKVFESRRNAVKAKNSYDNEYRIVSKDKRIKWVWDRGECVLNEKGEIVAFEGFVTDISESKINEQIIIEKSKEIQKQKSFYNNIIENLPVAVFIKDAKNDLRFTLWNKKAEEIYGLDKKAILGKNSFDLWEKEKADRYYLEDLEVSKHNIILNLPDNFVELKSGNSIYLNSKKVPILNNISGEVDFILCVSEDVTFNRKQADAIKENEAVLNTLFASAPIPMFLSSAISGKIVMANKELGKLLNIPVEELIGNATPNFYVNPENRKTLLEKVLNEIKVYNYDLQIHDLKGNVLDIVISSELIEINNEKMIFSGFLDVSGTKKQNKLLKESLSLIQATLNSTADGILVVDLEGNVTLYNDRVLEIWGANQENLLIIKDNKLDRAAILSKVKDKAEYSKKSLEIIGNLNSVTFDRFELIDGKVIERYTIPQVIDNNIVGRVSSFRDITEQVNILKELQLSKEQLEDTNNLAKVGGWELDLTNNQLSWSDITKEIHEVPLDFIPVLETAINFYKEGEDRENIAKAVEDGVKNGVPWDLELQIVTAKGNHRWVRANGKLDYIDGKRNRIYGTFQDIHDRKLLDLALQVSEAQHRILFDKNPLINITLDNEGIIISINVKGTSELGFTKDEIIGNSFLQLFKNENINKVESFLNVCRNSLGRLYNLVIDSVTKSNEVIWLSISATSMKNSTNEVIISIVCENITKEREIEEALLNSEANLRTVFESTEIGYILFDLNSDILTFNTPAYFFTAKQHKKELIQGRNIFDFFPNERYEYIKSILDRVYKGERIELETFKSNEFEVEDWFEIVYSPVKSKNNFIVGMVMSIKDITQSKKVQNELNLTLSQVETTNNKLQDIIRQKDKFFSIIAHDLRSPFSGFIGLTDIIKDELEELSTEDLKYLTSQLNHSANNLFKLLENLLEWSRMQRGLVEFTLEHISLFDKVNKNLELIFSKAELKSIKLTNNIPNIVNIKADSQMLDVVLRNLISNAVKFTPERGEVIISSKTNNGYEEICVADNGIGIPEEMIVSLFEIDSKSSRIGTAGEPSTGLGLMLCKEYIEKHGGKIWVENNLDKGSSFFFTIPNNP